MANKLPSQKYKTQFGELWWVFVTGDGRYNEKKGENQFSAVVHFYKDSDELKQLQDDVAKFWADNRPRKIKPKTTGIRRLMKKRENEDGEVEEIPTDYYYVTFRTGITFPDGKKKIIKVYNAKGNNITNQMQDRMIGNGSIGLLTGVMSIYDQKGADAGVTFYLNGIQLKKYVEYDGDPLLETPDEIEEGDFTGFDDELDVETGEEEEEKLDL